MASIANDKRMLIKWRRTRIRNRFGEWPNFGRFLRQAEYFFDCGAFEKRRKMNRKQIKKKLKSLIETWQGGLLKEKKFAGFQISSFNEKTEAFKGFEKEAFSLLNPTSRVDEKII